MKKKDRKRMRSESVCMCQERVGEREIERE